MWVETSDVWVDAPDVTVNGDGALVLELVLVDDVWVSVNDRAVAVSG